MRALGRFRQEVMRRQQETVSAPTRRSPYTSQVSKMTLADGTQISYSDILALDVQPAASIQNNDGTFSFLAGYDRLM